MASIPSNGYREVMAGSNIYTGSNLYGSICPQTPIVPVVSNDLVNKLYVDALVGGGTVVSVTAGNNIVMTGTVPAPVVNLQSPLTATLALGTQNITGTTSNIILTDNAALIEMGGAGLVPTNYGFQGINRQDTGVLSIQNSAAGATSGIQLNTFDAGAVISTGGTGGGRFKPATILDTFASAPGTAGQVLSSLGGAGTKWIAAGGTDPSVATSNANVVYYPTFVTGPGAAQQLYCDNVVTPISLNPFTGEFAISMGATVDADNTWLGMGAGIGSAAQNVAIGFAAGVASLGQNVAVGYQAGGTNQGDDSVGVGYQAGQTNQAGDAVAVGYQAGKTTQGASSVAIGANTANNSQGSQAVAVGFEAGFTSQGQSAVAMGYQAGYFEQGASSIAIGLSAAGDPLTSQGGSAIAIGFAAGYTNQQGNSIAIGEDAGYETQSTGAIAIGDAAGNITQGANSIAIGTNAGLTNQDKNAVAIGINAGSGGQGANAIAIGSGAGLASQTAGSICLNASGAALNPAAAGCFINPIRGVALGIGVGRVFYNTTTFELQYSTT